MPRRCRPTNLRLAVPALRPDQIDLLPTVSRPTLHPSGDRAIVSITRPDVAANDYVGQLWAVALDGSGPRRLTRGHRDTAPRFSPDGRMLAFLRAGPDGGKAQLHVVAAGGGEPIQLTELPLGVGEPVWSPEGTRIAVIARDPEPGRYGTDDTVAPDAEPPRLITDVRYLSDGIGYVGDRPAQVFLVDVPDPAGEPAADRGEPIRVTAGLFDVEGVAWSPDGARLALVSARHPGHHDDLRVEVWTCRADDSDLVPVTTGLTVELVRWSGSALWLLASDPGPSGLDFVGRSTGLWSVPADGSASPTRLTDRESVDLGEIGSLLTVIRAGVVVQDRAQGSVRLLRVPFDGGDPQVLLEGPLWVSGHDAVDTPDGPVIVASVQTADSPGDLMVVSPGEPRRITDLGAPLHASGALRSLHEVSVAADDGYPVHGWVVLPDGPGPHPVLLDIHGGPFTQFGWHIYDEAQVLAAAGYAVLLANPRGSAGYGQDHGRSITGAMGQRDAADLLDFLDGVLADPAFPGLDPDRIGVLGGSYGGYMTAWLTAHPRATGRFAAAIVERGFLDPTTFDGTSDIGWFFGGQYLGDDPEQVLAQSPMAAVGRVRTPTLVIHSERDYRCPLEQSQRYFAALHHAGIESELLIFPGESHGLTREGQPRHRRQRFDHLLRWWARYLPTPGNSGTAADVEPGP